MVQPPRRSDLLTLLGSKVDISSCTLQPPLADEQHRRSLLGRSSNLRAGRLSGVQPFPPEESSQQLPPSKRRLVRDTSPEPHPSPPNVAALLTHVATLQDELSRVREEQEMQRRLLEDELPPQYQASPPSQ